MKEITLSPAQSEGLAQIYQTMVQLYDRVAGEIGLTCSGCPDNCCDSYFLHHTVIEWAYMWQGLHELPADRLESIRERAAEYVDTCRRSLMKHRISRSSR